MKNKSALDCFFGQHLNAEVVLSERDPLIKAVQAATLYFNVQFQLRKIKHACENNA